MAAAVIVVTSKAAYIFIITVSAVCVGPPWMCFCFYDQELLPASVTGALDPPQEARLNAMVKLMRIVNVFFIICIPLVIIFRSVFITVTL